MDEERTLWELISTGELVRCTMRSCCTGAELQVWKGAEAVASLRELYPTKSDLYERALHLRAEYITTGAVVRSR